MSKIYTTWHYNRPSQNRFYGTQRNWNETIISKINELSGKIHTKNLRGGGNLLYCSSNIRSIIEGLSFYKDGQIGSRYDVKFVKSTENEISVLDSLGESLILKVMGYNNNVISGDDDDDDDEDELTDMLSNQLAIKINDEISKSTSNKTKHNRRRLLLIG